MGFQDIILGPLYLLLVYLVAIRLKPRLVLNQEDDKIYLKVLSFKLFAVSFFAFIYQFYYGGGDTFGFFSWTQRLVKYLFLSPGDAFEFIFTNNSVAFYQFKYFIYNGEYGYLLKEGTRELFFVKFMLIFNILGLNSYLAVSYLLTLCAFIANWLLYKVFVSAYQGARKQLVWSTMLIPSVAFWGGGVLKDTIAFIGICAVVYCFDQFFFQKKNRTRNLIYMFFFIYLIVAIRGFVVLSLLPAFVVWVFGTIKSKVKSGAIQALITPFILVGSVAVIFVLLKVVGNELDRFSIDQLDATIKDFQGWHEMASADGSGYTLNVHGSSPLQMLLTMPSAVNVTFFRPYLWEVSGAVVFLSAIEAFILFFFFLKVMLLDAKVFLFFKIIASEPLVQMCLVFALLYGFSVGFTSYNFGALSRYKIPAMPFFASMLVIISYRLKNPNGR